MAFCNLYLDAKASVKSSKTQKRRLRDYESLGRLFCWQTLACADGILRRYRLLHPHTFFQPRFGRKRLPLNIMKYRASLSRGNLECFSFTFDAQSLDQLRSLELNLLNQPSYFRLGEPSCSPSNGSDALSRIYRDSGRFLLLSKPLGPPV